MWANVGSHTRDYTYHDEVLLGRKKWLEEKESGRGAFLLHTEGHTGETHKE